MYSSSPLEMMIFIVYLEKRVISHTIKSFKTYSDSREPASSFSWGGQVDRGMEKIPGSLMDMSSF